MKAESRVFSKWLGYRKYKLTFKNHDSFECDGYYADFRYTLKFGYFILIEFVDDANSIVIENNYMLDEFKKYATVKIFDENGKVHAAKRLYWPMLDVRSHGKPIDRQFQDFLLEAI